MSPSLDHDAILAFILDWIEKDKDLPTGSLSADATFDDLALDSLVRMTLAGEIYDTFGCEFEASVMWDCKTPAALVEALTMDTSPLTLTKLSEGRSPHIILLYGLGGTARDLYPMVEGINRAESFNVSAIEQPFSAEAHITSAEDTIQQISSVIANELGDEPVIPFGYSFGGLLAMGLADELRSAGRNVPFTGLLDTNHPDAAHEPVHRTERLSTFLRHFPGWVSESILRAPPGERKEGIRALRRELRHLRGALRGNTRPGLKDVIREKGRPPAWDARTEENFNVLSEYCPKTHAGDVLLLRAKTRPLDGSLNQALNGWESVVQGDIQVLELRGTHATLLDTQRLDEAGKLLASALIQAQVSDVRNGSS